MKRLLASFLPAVLASLLLSSCLFRTGEGSALTTFQMPRTDKLGLDMLELPESCELAVRGDGDRRYAFVLNYLKTPAECRILRPARNLLTGETI